ncbi:MAG: tRNA nucleotidyltransferase (CCA-adding enzyme) [Alteromonadaceae bacterium]|jgi:tRNA nucleotidyltransferase (CCA-adding enzyme)
MIENKDLSQLTTYLVGGAVRDKLLARAVYDRDYVVIGATVEQMLTLGFVQVGKDFPVFLHPQSKEEYALARTERKQGSGYTGFTCFATPDVTLAQDLYRRDLTINAMAMTEDGEIIDPYHGQQDLENRILRHVSDAFIEDPLRVLRVARFAARYYSYGFSIADETMQLMTQLSNSGELTTLSGERIWKEMQRSLAESNPEVFFQVLYQCNALKEIWPDLHNLWGVPNPAKWHPEICSGLHTMMVLQQAVKLSTKTSVRFAALCHDLGKSLTLEEHWPAHQGHEKSGLPLVEHIADKLKVPNAYKRLALKVCQFHLHCHKAFELKASTILKMFNQLDVWRKPEEFNDFLIACHADATGRLGLENKPYHQSDYLHQLFLQATSVNTKEFVQQGLKGGEIKQAIELARLKIITAVKDSYPVIPM